MPVARGDDFAAFAGQAPAPAPDFSAFDPPAVAKPVPPAAKKRVRYAGYWWDEFPDGRLLWCTECNGPYPAAGVPGVVVVDWNGGKPPAPGVAAPQPFRSGTAVNNAGHNCPACGAAQYRVSGAGPVAGSHTHTCDRCGQSWWH